MPKIASLIAVAALPLAAFAPARAATAEPPCAALVATPGATGYRDRGSRCEGLFVEDVRSSVRLKGLLAHTRRPPDHPDSSVLHATIPDTAPTGDYHLRVQSTDPRVNYQLDASIHPGTAFSWPVNDVIQPAQVDAALLAPLTWVTADEMYYVPTYLSDTPDQGTGEDSPSVLIVLESTVPIETYVARLSARSGGPPATVTGTSPLPATRLDLDLPPRDDGGFYTLWLRVRLVGESRPEPLDFRLWLP